MPDNMTAADRDQRKLLSVLCHGACFFSSTIVSVGIPILILMLTDDQVVKANAKEALIFQINVFIWALIGIVLMFVLIGFAILGCVLVISLIAPIVAIVKVISDPDRCYRYPLVFRIM